MNKTPMTIMTLTREEVKDEAPITESNISTRTIAKEIFIHCDTRGIKANTVVFNYFEDQSVEVLAGEGLKFCEIFKVRNSVPQEQHSDILTQTEKFMYGKWLLGVVENLVNKTNHLANLYRGVKFSRKESFGTYVSKEPTLLVMVATLFTRFGDLGVENIAIEYSSDDVIEIIMHTKDKRMPLVGVTRLPTRMLRYDQRSILWEFAAIDPATMIKIIGGLFDIPHSKWKSEVITPPEIQMEVAKCDLTDGKETKRIVALENCLYVSEGQLTTTVITNGIMARYVAMGTPLAQVNVIRKGLFGVQVEGNGAKLFEFYNDPSIAKEYIANPDYFHDKEINEMKSWLLNNFYHEE